MMDRAMLKMLGHQLASIQNQVAAMMAVIEDELKKPESVQPAETRDAKVNGSGAQERQYFGGPPRSPATSPSD